MGADSLAEIKVEDFAAHVGESFEVALEENGLPVTQLTLISAAELVQLGGREGRIPFKLTFEGPSSVALEQGICWFERPDFGAHGIFIVPIGAKGDTRTYEAIFS